MRHPNLPRDRGFILLEAVLSISILGMVVATCLPAWWAQYRQLGELVTKTRNAQELNWMASRICDDTRFNPSGAGYQYDGTRVRRIVNGSIQILNSVPITTWQAPSIQNGYWLIIQTKYHRRTCDCSPWNGEK